MSTSVSEIVEQPKTPTVGRKRSDFVYYGLRNKKLVFGLGLELLLVLFAIIGPMIAKYGPQDLTGAQIKHPNGTYWLGTDTLGRDIFSQLANGIRESYLVGALGAVSASVVGMALGFTAGWRGGILDEVLQMITNIIVMLPSLVLLVVIGSYLNSRSVLFEGVFIGLTTWPWVARAVRAQTFSLRSREFVEMAKLSGRRPVEIIVRDIAPNMASYLFLVVILLFGSSMLLAASYDFLGLGPTNDRLARLDDEPGNPERRPPLPRMVVVRPARRGADRDGRGPARRQRRPGRGLQPEVEAAVSVSVEKLSVAYRSHRGDVTAVDNVSFALADGEIMGLAGESGSGKSTLGNALIYLDQRMKATGGTVTVDGRELPIADTRAMRPLRMAEVSLVPQYAMSALPPDQEDRQADHRPAQVASRQVTGAR